MTTEPEKREPCGVLWHADPSDWSPWLVHADQLTCHGDGRGELLLVEQALQGDSDVDLFLKEWLAQERLYRPDREHLEWAIDLKEKLQPLLAWAPLPLRNALARPISQVLALAPLETEWRGEHHPASRWVQQHHKTLVDGLVDWLRMAFDGAPCPDRKWGRSPQHDESNPASVHPAGRWQDLPDAYLLQNHGAISYLDPEGLSHYLPALMCLDLQQRFDSRSDAWFTTCVQSALQPSRTLADHQRQQFAQLTLERRRAIAAYCCGYDDGTHLPWRSAILEPEEDWISVFQRWIF